MENNLLTMSKNLLKPLSLIFPLPLIAKVQRNLEQAYESGDFKLFQDFFLGVCKAMEESDDMDKQELAELKTLIPKLIEAERELRMMEGLMRVKDAGTC
jgi:hypothetical protein